MDILVSSDWLSHNLGADDLVILDASAHLPAAGRDPKAEFAEGHIAGARFLDLPSLKDADTPVPAALPTAEQFSQRLRQLGVKSSDRVVLYDNSVLRSSARAFFMFRIFGFAQVALLDGGLPAWKAHGGAVESGEVATQPSTYSADRDDRSRVRTKEDILANCTSCCEQVVDARDAGRFTAEVGDTVHGLAGGHIPGARNLHFVRLLNDNGTFKDKASLREEFATCGIDLDRPVTGSCGSGITASVVLFALELLGKHDAALYDGSWSEWGADPATPKEQGPAR